MPCRMASIAACVRSVTLILWKSEREWVFTLSSLKSSRRVPFRLLQRVLWVHLHLLRLNYPEQFARDEQRVVSRTVGC